MPRTARSETDRRLRRPLARRGFTLIELMIVVAILGLLASIAIPEFSRYVYRSKTTERKIMLRKVTDEVLQGIGTNGRLPNDFIDLTPNPPGQPGPYKQTFDPLLWGGFLVQPAGATYFRYYVFGMEGDWWGFFETNATGDLDGDGVPSVDCTYHYKTGQGVWVEVTPCPWATTDGIF